MAYMMMLITDDARRLEAVLQAWDTLHVDKLVTMDSTCYHRAGTAAPHIPMRFMFEALDQGQYQCSVTLFGIVEDEAAAQDSLARAEAIIGDLDTAPNTMFAAWPLSIVKGLPKQAGRQGGAAR